MNLSLTSGDVKGWCAAGGPSYQTVTKHLEPFKTGRGKWDLTVQEKLETYISTTINNLL